MLLLSVGYRNMRHCTLAYNETITCFYFRTSRVVREVALTETALLDIIKHVDPKKMASIIRDADENGKG